MADSSVFSADELTDKLPLKAWMIRPCAVYKSEYLECTSTRGRIHQYYINGYSNPDCHKWKEDYDNCMAVVESKFPELASKIIENEDARRSKRLADARSNDVWEYRKEPPANWAGPLPEWSKKNESQYFTHQQGIIDSGLQEQQRMCIIS
ncbi:synaptic plasticity regulator PANTS-like isoform X3 [Lineus longissimus]|uniref:synaptic plasticity regulator PANTS-like isoform X3 n=1 Tax=Lineus longissimus TaxID=88925 RepID=UPI002B4EE13A